MSHERVGARTSFVLAAVAAAAVGIETPWWAMGSTSPVVDNWGSLAIGVWLSEILIGCVLSVARGRPRVWGRGLVVGSVCGVVGFVLLYGIGFSLGSWD